MGQGYIIFGFLVAIYPFMQFLATPILGQLSDKFGRKKILGVSLAGTFIGYILFAIGILIKNIPLLFISRALDGITGGNISVAQAVWWGLLIVTPFFAFTNGLSQANITGLISRSVGPEIQGEILGINASVSAIAQVIPAMLSGFIAASLTPYYPSIVAAGVTILGGIILIAAYRKQDIKKAIKGN